MNCRSVMRVLIEYLDDELQASERAAVAAHLQTCAACRAEEAALRRAEGALTTLAVVEPAPDLAADLHHRISALSPPRARPLRWAWCGVAVVVVAVATALVVRIYPRTAPQPIPVPRPVEIATPAPRASATSAVPHHQRTRPTAVALRRPRRQHFVAHAPPPKPVHRDEVSAEPATLETAPTPLGLILLLGPPRELALFSSYNVEVSMPDGTQSLLRQEITRDETGEPVAITMICENIGGADRPPNQGG